MAMSLFSTRREHDRAVLGEDPREVSSAAVRFEIAICDFKFVNSSACKLKCEVLRETVACSGAAAR